MNVDNAEEYIIGDERLCTFIDDDDCRATFVHGYHNITGQLLVWVQGNKDCPVQLAGKKCIFLRSNVFCASL